MEPISPELCLVDPVLACEARALLPDLSIPDTVIRRPLASPGVAVRERILRAGAWLLVPSILLNVALLRSRTSPPGPSFDTPAATATDVTPAPTGSASRSSPAHGVLAVKAAPEPDSGRPTGRGRGIHRARTPVTRRTLEWPATPGATSYDLVLWRDHRRVVDLWPKKSRMPVAKIACATGRRLEAGRYLWFVYPVVGARRYGKLARWGAIEVDPKTCSGT